MNFPLNPNSGSLIFPGKVLEGAAVVEVLLEKYSAKSDTTTPGGKTGSTIKASILLNSSMMAIFLSVIGATLGTLFYKPSVKKSFLSTILPCFSEVFSMPFSDFNSFFFVSRQRKEKRSKEKENAKDWRHFGCAKDYKTF